MGAFRCPYIYPREEDWVVSALVERGERILVAGVRGSGITTLLERLVALSGPRLRKVSSPSEAAKVCRAGAYPVYDARGLEDALDALGRCERVVVGVSLGLLDLAGLPARVRGASIVVLKPLAPGEIYDYMVNVLGVRLADWELLDEVMWRTGGFPGPLCRAVAEHKLYGTVLTWERVSLLGDMPGWLREALETSPRELRALALHVFLARFDEGLARELGAPLEAPWLERSGGRLQVWPELLWLRPLLERLYPAEAKRAYEAGLSRCSSGSAEPYLCFHYASALYSMTGLREHGLLALDYAERSLAEVRDLAARHRLVRGAAELAMELEPRRAIKWLRELIAAYERVEPAPPELGWLLSAMRELLGQGHASPAEYAEAALGLAMVLAAWGKLEELEALISDVERALQERLGRPEARTMELAYLLALAARAVATSSWREAWRLLGEAGRIVEGSGATFLRAYHLLLARTLVALGDVEGAKRVVGEARRSGTLTEAEANDFEALAELMELEPEGLESFAKRWRAAESPLARTLAAVAEALAGGKRRRVLHPHWLNSLLTALELVRKGRVQEAYLMVRPVMDEMPQLALIALDLAIACLSPSKAERTAVISALEQLREELERAQLRGAIRPVDEMIEALRRGDYEATRAPLVKLIAYSLL